MTPESQRQKMLTLIRRNIQTHGRHIYSVIGGESPQFLYTIGLYEKSGVELVFAGGALFEKRSIASLLNRAAAIVETGQRPSDLRMHDDDIGPVRLIKTHQSWVSRLLLGALDYYDIPNLPVWQMIPEDDERYSFDIPNTAKSFDVNSHPVWRWFDQACPQEIPKNSIAVSDLDVMLGYAATEITRRTNLEWEVYSAGQPDCEALTYRVPLITLLAFDDTLLPAVDIPIGQGLVRSFNTQGTANAWVPRA